MNEPARSLLEASIRHWEQILVDDDRDAIDVVGRSCPLCQHFAGIPHPNPPPIDNGKIFTDCYGCPVSARTGEDQCTGTPWYNAYNALNAWRHYGYGPDLEKYEEIFCEAARRELEFLKSLREENGNEPTA